jgi:hypothetical protein
MKRLNEMVDVLLNPTTRHSYEAQLDGRVPRHATPPVIVVAEPPKRERWLNLPDARSVALFLAGMACATVLWYTVDAGRGSQALSTAAGQRSEPAAGAEEFSARLAALDRRLSDVENDRKPPIQHSVLPAIPSGLAGSWYSGLDVGTSGSTGIQASRRIDLNILSDNGILRGTYSAQGNPLVGGNAVNSVNFQFEGKGTGTHARLPWSAGNAKGEIELRLMSADLLEANWWAYEMGAPGAENYGTAILRRRRTGHTGK